MNRIKRLLTQTIIIVILLVPDISIRYEGNKQVKLNSSS